MTYNEKEDERGACGELTSAMDYDSPQSVKDDEEAIVLYITSNDDELHLPSFGDTIENALDNYINEDGIDKIKTELIDAIKKDDRLTTNRWEFSIPLKGPTYDKLVVVIYPNYESWKHLREKEKAGHYIQ